MTYMELKTFLDSLTPEQLTKEAFFYPELQERILIRGAEVLEEPLYFDPDYTDEGSFPKSAFSEEEWNDNYQLAFSSGEIMILG